MQWIWDDSFPSNNNNNYCSVFTWPCIAFACIALLMTISTEMQIYSEVKIDVEERWFGRGLWLQSIGVSDMTRNTLTRSTKVHTNIARWTHITECTTATPYEASNFFLLFFVGIVFPKRSNEWSEHVRYTKFNFSPWRQRNLNSIVCAQEMLPIEPYSLPTSSCWFSCFRQTQSNDDCNQIKSFCLISTSHSSSTSSAYRWLFDRVD